MLKAEEIYELKKDHQGLEKSLEKIGKDQLATVVRLSERLEELISGIEEVKEKEETAWNPALTTRIKMAKKEFRLTKALSNFEREVASEFERGNISEDAGKRFISIVRLWKNNKKQEAKTEFGYFKRINDLGKRYYATEEELKDKERELRRSQLRIEKLITEMSDLEKENVDLEMSHRYAELLRDIEELNSQGHK
ncbi:MAG: hypothetical protein AB1529_00895 [Candidatus Micrarchaeota archaeon]